MTTDRLHIRHNSSHENAFSVGIDGEAHPRLAINANGTIETGDGTSDPSYRIGSVGDWGPQDSGYVAWNYDPVTATLNNTGALTSGTLYLARLRVPAYVPITRVDMWCGSSVGDELTAVYFSLYDASLSKLAESDNVVNTAFQTINTLTGGDLSETYMPTKPMYVYAGLHVIGTTGPTLGRAGTNNGSNANMGSTTYRHATSSTGLDGAPPASAGSLSAYASGFWAGLR